MPEKIVINEKWWVPGEVWLGDQLRIEELETQLRDTDAELTEAKRIIEAAIDGRAPRTRPTPTICHDDLADLVGRLARHLHHARLACRGRLTEKLFY